jgi:hypothetical protein
MQYNPEYVKHLENTITDILLPVYKEYYKLVKKDSPRLNIDIIKPKQIPKLFQKY